MPEHRKLAFYSDQDAPANSAMDERVMALIGRLRPSIGYVASAPDPAREYFQRTREHYAQRGADLDCYLDAERVKDAEAVARLLACDAIHLSGGNTFVFNAWLKGCGLARQLAEYSRCGGVLIGVSAGAMVMTPSVLSAEWCGDVRPSNATDDTGLGLVGFHFWPHYSRRLEGGGQPVNQAPLLADLYGCPDGSGIVVDGDRIELFGEVERV